jgi:hypothetical protein
MFRRMRTAIRRRVRVARMPSATTRGREGRGVPRHAERTTEVGVGVDDASGAVTCRVEVGPADPLVLRGSLDRRERQDYGCYPDGDGPWQGAARPAQGRPGNRAATETARKALNNRSGAGRV